MADVVVEVRRVRAEGGDRVHVHVQDPVPDRKPELLDSRLFPRLAQGGREDGLVAGLQVAAGLEPAAELAVPHEQELGGETPNEDRARGDVAFGVGPGEGARTAVDEIADDLEALLLESTGRRVRG